MGPTRATLSALDDDSVPLRVDLRQWVLGLDRAQLIVVHGWIRSQLQRVAMRPSFPIGVPSEGDALQLSGEYFTGLSFEEMAGHVRMHICELPKPYLVVLEAYLMRGHDAG